MIPFMTAVGRRNVVSGTVEYGAGATAPNNSSGDYVLTVPAGVNRIQFNIWGSGGGYAGAGSSANGGGGGFTTYTLRVVPTQQFLIRIGAIGGSQPSGSIGAGGGGYSGVFSSTTTFTQATAIAIAGGGGGGTAGYNWDGGAGGGSSGQDGERGTASSSGLGGTQTSGSNALSAEGPSGTAGGGGSGFFGGGRGNEGATPCSGGGGSGYINIATPDFISGSTSTGNFSTPANTGHSQYEANAGRGGLGASSTVAIIGRIVVNYGLNITSS